MTSPELNLPRLAKASLDLGYPFKPLESDPPPASEQIRVANSKCLLVFRQALKETERVIRQNHDKNGLTRAFREEDLRPELSYIRCAFTEFRVNRSVNIPGGEETLTKIIGLLSKAITHLNSADDLDKIILEIKSSGGTPGRQVLNDYSDCFIACAELLYEVQVQLGACR